jgi:photosystem II stability/assembly factor-like uncharacterized protein
VSSRALLVGTKKGLFIGRADAARREWRFSGPHCSGTWSFFDVAFDRRAQTIYAGGASNWYGPAVWRSPDGGASWEHSSVGLSLGDGQPPVEQVWRIIPAGELLYAGTDPAGLFRSEDGGRTWRHLPALRQHPTSAAWRPSNAGLPLHAIVPGPGDTQRMWVAVSAGGVYRTDDGGESWTPCGAELHACVHALEPLPGTNGAAVGAVSSRSVLYRQAHDGIHCSYDGAATWRDVTGNLPSRFGFALATTGLGLGRPGGAAGRAAGTVYAVPLEGGEEGRRHVPGRQLAVWRFRAGAKPAGACASWEQLRCGLPDEPSFASVLRRGLVVDPADPGAVYCGTATGQLYGSLDGGDTWFAVARALPPIYAVACAELP